MAAGIKNDWFYASLPANTKTLHLIRHGQAEHNVAAYHDPSAYTDERYLDARLTSDGIRQVRAVAPQFGKGKKAVDVVIVSSLTRTVQTAREVFGGLRPAAPFVATDRCREAHGKHFCDKRRPISEIRRDFPDVDFSDIKSDEDVDFRVDQRETVVELRRRCYLFLQWLFQRPEQNIAVVSHGVFLETLLQQVLAPMQRAVVPADRWRNAECRTLTVTAAAAPAWVDMTMQERVVAFGAPQRQRGGGKARGGGQQG